MNLNFILYFNQKVNNNDENNLDFLKNFIEISEFISI